MSERPNARCQDHESPDSVASPPAAGLPRWAQWALSAFIVACAVGMLVIPKIRPTRWYIEPKTNTNFAEAIALLSGRLDLPEHYLDTALVDGKIYNVYPPAFTFISLAVIAPQKLVLEPGDPPFILPALLVVLIFLPLPLLGFWMFARCTKDPARTAMWTVYWLAGSSLLPVLVRCENASMYYVNHALSQTGLLLVLGDLLGRRRIWPALIGLMLAGWSRQLMIVYAVPIIWVVVRQVTPQRRARWLIVTAVVVVVIVGVQLGLNTLKFGHPLENGYRYVLEQWSPDYHDASQSHGLFSPHYIPTNAWHMFCALPPLQWKQLPAIVLPESKVQDLGVSLLFTTPVALFVLIDVRRWWRDGFRRWWMLTSVAVILALLCYQSTGWRQPGFHRFTLDFLLPWLVVIAPGCATPRRTWIVAAMLAWSVAYFQATCQLKLPWPIAG